MSSFLQRAYEEFTSSLRRHYRLCDEFNDQFRVAYTSREILLEYVADVGSCSPARNESRRVRRTSTQIRAEAQSDRTTCLTLRWHRERRELWIEMLQVQSAARDRGHGRQLVTAVEAFARAREIKNIVVYPLAGASGFWRRVGFNADPARHRVLIRPIELDRQTLSSSINSLLV